MSEQVLRLQFGTTQSTGYVVSLRAAVRATTALWDPEEASERRWQETFAASQDFLAELGDKALADFLAGNTEVLDPDNL